MVKIRVYQHLINNVMYEHKILKNNKKFYKQAGKYDS